jgi:ATP-dependent Clp protease ATP-binding subunit ClpC
MSEYMEKHNVSRLIGAPPGYVGYEEGGQLTEKIRRRPYSVVLLDEIEKAHPDVFSLLLQIMEEGRLTDSYGHNVDFKNSIVIMTTNIGAEAIKDQTAFGFSKRNDEVTYDKMKEMVMARAEKEFRPEFLNRVDDFIVFHGLTRKNLEAIVHLELSKLRERLKERSIVLDLDPAAIDYCIEKGYNPDFGARPLRRAIENLIEEPLSEDILSGRLKENHLVKVKLVDEGHKHLTFTIEQQPSTQEELAVGAGASGTPAESN